MSRPCVICSSSTRPAIEAAMDAGGTIRAVAAAHGVSPAGLHRHLAHRLETAAPAPAAITVTPASPLDRRWLL